MGTQNELLNELVAVRIKRVLARTSQQYERNFYNTVGRGVSPQEYAGILDKLVAHGVVKRAPGQKPGTTILTLVKANTQE